MHLPPKNWESLSKEELLREMLDQWAKTARNDLCRDVVWTLTAFAALIANTLMSGHWLVTVLTAIMAASGVAFFLEDWRFGFCIKLRREELKRQTGL